MVADAWRRLPARLRITAVAMLAVAVVVGTAAFALVVLMRRELVAEVETSARFRANEIARDLSAGDEPSLVVVERDEQFVQIVDGDGRVVASSDNVRGAGAVARRPRAPFRLHLAIDEDPFVAVTARASTGPGPVTVVVGRAISDAYEAAADLARLLALVVPLLVAAIGAITWAVATRALRPVDAMRGEVDSISPTELSRRVPVPPANDEIGRLATTMNRMLERLEHAQERQRRFVADAAHELRSPLAAIRQHAEVAKAHPDRADLDGVAGAVLAESLRLQRLTDNLLSAALADAGALAATLDRVPVDLDDIVFSEARRLRETGGVRVDTSAVSAARVEGDAAALRRIVRNVADNAVRHTRSTVAFRLSAAGGTATLVVDDDGPGIAPAERERVFERFVRLDEARSRDRGGAGLGLSIVADLVAAHRGRVAIGESPSGGARVTVELPAG